jgi:flagellar hook-length control protein FliK
MKPLPDNGQSSDPALAAFAGRIDHLHSAAEPAGAMPAHRVQAPSGAMHVEGHKFVITRHDGTSIEVSLQPEGLGKLDIELVFDKGLVNAHIQASHEAGKELVEQNMTEILNILAQEGITIGGFSVSLKQGRDAEPEGMKRGFQRRNDEDAARGEEAIIRKNSRQGVISIFV